MANRLRKPRAAVAPAAPVRIKQPTIGQAKPVMRSPSISPARPVNSGKVGVSPGRPVAGPGAPPQQAAPAPSGPPPESLRTRTERQEAGQGYQDAQAKYNHDIYMAALAYGDPSVIAQYGDIVPTPDSALATAEREGGEARKSNALAHNANNTFFSGMNLEDVRKIGDTEAIARKNAQDAWEKAKFELGVALQEAQREEERLRAQAAAEDLQNFEESQPEPQGTPSGGTGGQSKPKPKPKPSGPSIGQGVAVKSKKGKK